jgi:hypothetical protein
MWPFQDALKAGAGNIMSVSSKMDKSEFWLTLAQVFL